MQTINRTKSNICFGRLPLAETPVYTRTVKRGLNLLGKQVDIIIHNSCAPSKRGQNAGVGSLLSEASEKKLAPFLEKHGISSVQIEPDGLRKVGNGSPYEGDTFAKNVLMIPIEKLQKDKYGAILSSKTFQKIVNNRPNKRNNRVDYNYVIPAYEKALRESFNTFVKKSANIAKLKSSEAEGIKNLSKEFEIFKKEKGSLLQPNSFYSVLSKIHKNDYWLKWNNEIDKVLFCPPKSKKLEAKARIAEIKKNYANDIDFFMFKQMLVAKARKESTIKTIGDSAVAFSNIDVWANQKLFKKGWHLGCPPDYFSKTGQAWGFAVLDPKYLFKKDGSLGKGGELLFHKYETMFKDNPGGVRIDHIIGLIDPFVYKDSPISKTAGRLYSSPNNKDLAQYAKMTLEEHAKLIKLEEQLKYCNDPIKIKAINKKIEKVLSKETVGKYAQIMERIVIPAAKSAGVKAENIICEDLGEVTNPTKAVMKLIKLRGVAITQFSNAAEDNIYRGKNVPPEKVIMKGSHDNIPDVKHVEKLFKNEKEKVSTFAKAFAEDLLPKNATARQRKIFQTKIKNSPEKFREAGWAELFTSPAKKIQVFVEDFFGGNRTYNSPGTNGPQNWSIRMSSNFENLYLKRLEQGKGLNLPQAIATAIAQKGDNFVKKNQELYNKLRYFARLLKEKSN